MTRWIELYSPDFTPLRHELFESRTVVGTGSEATFRVPLSTGLEALHFWVDSTDSGVTVVVQDSPQTGLCFEGQECRSITVPWGSEVFVGNTRVAFLQGSIPISSKGTTFLLATALILGLLGIGIYKSSDWGPASEPSSEAPPLNELGSVRCSDAIPVDAEHTARENERAARAKQQRFPFDPQDGVEAVDMLRTSEACYRVAGRPDEASQAHAAMEEWSQVINSEYSTVRLRLKYDLEHDRFAEALKRVDEIRALLAPHGKGGYYRWLAQTRETLVRRLASLQQ